MSYNCDWCEEHIKASRESLDPLLPQEMVDEIMSHMIVKKEYLPIKSYHVFKPTRWRPFPILEVIVDGKRRPRYHGWCKYCCNWYRYCKNVELFVVDRFQSKTLYEALFNSKHQHPVFAQWYCISCGFQQSPLDQRTHIPHDDSYWKIEEIFKLSNL